MRCRVKLLPGLNLRFVQVMATCTKHKLSLVVAFEGALLNPKALLSDIAQRIPF